MTDAGAGGARTPLSALAGAAALLLLATGGYALRRG
jgi:hypothetical protein